MSWVKLSDDYYDHEKVMAAGPLAETLWVRSVAWANRNLKDGHLPLAQLRRLAEYAADYNTTPDALAQILVAAGLWQETEKGYLVVNYLKYQASAEQIRGRQIDLHEKRAKAGRQGGLAGVQKVTRDPSGRFSPVTEQNTEQNFLLGSEGVSETPASSLVTPSKSEQTVSKSEAPTPTPTKSTPTAAASPTAGAGVNTRAAGGDERLETLQEPHPSQRASQRPQAARVDREKREPFEEDFAEVWTHYPRKDNRGKALRAYQARRRAGSSAVDLLTATRHYALERTGEEPRYTMHGSTFFGRDEPWREHLEAPAASAVDPLATTLPDPRMRLSNDDPSLEGAYL